MITETAVGGDGAEAAVPLSDDAAVQQFAAQFDDDRDGDPAPGRSSTTEVPDGKLLYGAVVAIGCDVADRRARHRRRPGTDRSPPEVAEPDAGVLRPDDHRRGWSLVPA